MLSNPHNSVALYPSTLIILGEVLFNRLHPVFLKDVEPTSQGTSVRDSEVLATCGEHWSRFSTSYISKSTDHSTHH